ncbi:MAG: hypothetical protein IPK22_17265 [Verrucomicrobiaceae bacterium]|nr:hypothetical protein [Verrucomicrobiaceae bacterium]
MMKQTTFMSLALFSFVAGAFAVEDEGGFHSIKEWQALGTYPDQYQQNLEEVFDHVAITKILPAAKRVRMVRFTPDTDYWDFESKIPVVQMSLGFRSIELTKTQFSPLLKHLGDFDNYGDSTICSFEPGIAIFIGDDEPEFIVICCFKCHDIHIVRRPTKTHPMPHVSRLGMSPELEENFFHLAQTTFPKDEDLKNFKLEKLYRSKTPLKSSSPSRRLKRE